MSRPNENTTNGSELENWSPQMVSLKTSKMIWLKLIISKTLSSLPLASLEVFSDQFGTLTSKCVWDKHCIATNSQIWHALHCTNCSWKTKCKTDVVLPNLGMVHARLDGIYAVRVTHSFLLTQMLLHSKRCLYNCRFKPRGLAQPKCSYTA